MDSQKDIENKQDGIGLNPILKDSSLVKREAFFDYLFKKTEKISTALFMVTNLLPENEPLRLRLREQSLCLLSKKVLLCHSSSLHKERAIEECSVLLVEVTSLLQIAHYSGFVSLMNFSIINKELQNLNELFRTKEVMKRSEDSFLFSSDFFGASVSREGNVGSVPLVVPVIQKETQKTEVTPFVYKGQNQVKNIKDKKPSGASKSDRQITILALFHKRKDDFFSIKDIAESVKDCSEKTIQRELLELVAKGVLKKEGERRWSKYSLK